MMRLKAILLVLLLQAGVASAQPLADSLKALQQRNDKMYRSLPRDADDRGLAYSYTNVNAWLINDPDLFRQIETIVRSQPFGERALNKIDVSDILVFVAPAGEERYEPFHITFKGRRQADVDTTGGEAGDDPFGVFGGGPRRSSEDLYIGIKGRDVVRLMQRVPALKEAISTVQGELVELPGDILPSGVQLVKSSYQRYIFNKMFTGFYSKAQIIDEQRYSLGLPSTRDEEFIPDSTMADLQIEMDPDQTTALPDQEVNMRAFRYEKFVELGADRLMANINANNAIEVTLGNPEVGLPFTSSGMGRLSYVMRNLIGSESNVKLGLAFPASTIGREEFLLFPERRISGGWGGSIDAYFAGIDFFSAFNMPLQFSATIIPSQGSNASIIYNGGEYRLNPVDGNPEYTIPANRVFYRTSVIGNMTIPIIVQLDPANFLQFGAGIGVHIVQRSFIPRESDFDGRFNPGVNNRNGDVNLVENVRGWGPDDVGKMQDLERVSTPVTPRVTLQYVNHRSNKFGLNFMYDHLFSFGGWVEIVDNFLRLDMSYTAAIVRDPKPYEPAGFFFITPRLYF